jgi:hypothetical protein
MQKGPFHAEMVECVLLVAAPGIAHVERALLAAVLLLSKRDGKSSDDNQDAQP